MADLGGKTPHVGIPYAGEDSPARVAVDAGAALMVIDAKLAELDGMLKARDEVFVAHDGAGAWSVHNGLGEPLDVHAGADGEWEVIK